MVRRQRVAHTDDWQQLQLLAPWPEQLLYEALRPVVLFGQSPAEHGRQISIAQRRLYRLADRFDQAGMRSLFAPPPIEKHRRLPQANPELGACGCMPPQTDRGRAEPADPRRYPGARLARLRHGQAGEGAA